MKKYILITVLLIFMSIEPLYCGGWLKKAIDVTYRGVKKIGQEVVEKPARKLFKKKKKHKNDLYKTNYNYVEPKKEKEKKDNEFEKIDIESNDLKKEYSLDNPYNGGTHNYNRSPRIESIIGLIDFTFDGSGSKSELEKKLKKLSNLEINHLYYGLLTMQESSFFDTLSTFIAADIKNNNFISGGFVTYNVSTMNFRKMSNILVQNDRKLLTWRKKVKFPDVAESFFIIVSTHKSMDSLANNNELLLAQGISMDGWRVIYNIEDKSVKISYFTPEGFIFDCDSQKISMDRFNNY